MTTASLNRLRKADLVVRLQEVSTRERELRKEFPIGIIAAFIIGALIF